MKKLITALLLAALVLSGCVKEENPTENDVDTTESTPETETTPAETEPETEAAPDPGSPVKFSLDEIPKGEVYFTVCRHIRGGNLYIKTDALLAEYSPDKLENYCYYIPYGDSPEILETAEGGGAFVVDDNGLRVVVIDGGVF